MINLGKLFESFKYAIAGLRKVFWQEQNFRIHIITSLIVITLAVFFEIEAWQFIVIILIISLVLILEIINTIFERLLDLLKPRLHQYVKDIKDMTAAAVFISSLAAIIIGLIIFLPYFIQVFIII